MAKKVIQNLANIYIDIISTKDEKPETYITIHQDGKTIFLEHGKIVEFFKTINTFK